MISCPVCGSHVEIQEPTETDAELFVFETFTFGDDEIYAGPVREYICVEDPDHIFYMDPYADKGAFKT